MFSIFSHISNENVFFWINSNFFWNGWYFSTNFTKDVIFCVNRDVYCWADWCVFCWHWRLCKRTNKSRQKKSCDSQIRNICKIFAICWNFLYFGTLYLYCVLNRKQIFNNIFLIQPFQIFLLVFLASHKLR